MRTRAQGTQFREIDDEEQPSRKRTMKNRRSEEEPTSEREPEQQGQQEGGEGQVSSNPQVNRVVPGGPTDSVGSVMRDFLRSIKS